MAASMKERRAVPDYIDEVAKKVPHDTWAIVPRSSSKLHQGWNHLNFSDLAGAVNNLAWWIEKNIGVSQQPGNTIGYMGYVSSGHFLPKTTSSMMLRRWQCKRSALCGHLSGSLEDRVHTFIYVATQLPRRPGISNA